MPTSIITVSVRGFDKDKVADAMDKALERLDKFNSDQQAGNITVDEGVAFRVEDPGNGGPCAPDIREFQYDATNVGLPEAKKKDD